MAQKVEEDFFQKRQVAVKKIPRMKQRSLTSYCRKIPISPNFSLQPCRRKAPEICLLENCIIQQIPQKLKSLEPVEAQGFRWSCYPDLNWGPHPYQKVLQLLKVYPFMLKKHLEFLVLQWVQVFSLLPFPLYIYIVLSYFGLFVGRIVGSSHSIQYIYYSVMAPSPGHPDSVQTRSVLLNQH